MKRKGFTLIEYFIMKKQAGSLSGEAGQTLLEVLLAFGVSILALSVGVLGVITSLSNAQYTKNQGLANSYAQEGMAVIRQIRDSSWNNFSSLYKDYRTNTTYCLGQNPLELKELTLPNRNCWAQSPVPAGGIFSREVKFEHNSPSCCSDNSCSTGIAGSKVTVTVSWSDNKCSTGNSFCHKVELVTCFSNTSTVAFSVPTPTPVFPILTPTPSKTWYNASYGYRKQITINGSTTRTLDLQVNASGNDCIRNLEANSFTVSPTGLWTGWWLNGWRKGGAAARFTSVSIPKGSIITTAYLTLTANTSLTGTTVNTKVSAENVDDAATFAGLTGTQFDTRFAAHTTTRVIWNSIGSWTQNVTTNAVSPELKTVVQEVVNRAGWSSGNSMVFFWEDFDNQSTSNIAYRNAYGYAGSSTKAPKLHIEYTSPLTNYQMKITVKKGTGTDSNTNVYLNNHVQDNFNDIRFTKSDGIAPLDYWVESYTSGTSATVWVEFDSIPVSPSTANFYIYYGNASASSGSNGDNTFVFFDDFPGASIDTNKWTRANSGGSYAIESGQLSLTDSNTAATYEEWKTISSFSDPIIIELDAATQLQSTYTFNMYANYLASGRHIKHTDATTNGWSIGTDYSNGDAITTGQLYHMKMVFHGANATLYVDGVQKGQSFYTPGSSQLGLRAYLGDASGWSTSHVHYDNIFVRKYASPEPTWGIWGAEEAR